MLTFAFDTETHLIEGGMLTPKMVCGSFYIRDYASGAAPTALLCLPDESIERLLTLLDAGAMIVGANIAYDFGVVLAYVAHDAALYRRLRDAIFLAYDTNRVWDVQIAEALWALAQGYMGIHPLTRQEIKRYSLAIVVELTLGRTDAKENDDYRLRYAELDGLPIAQWPEPARVYPIDDAKNTHEAFDVQMRRAQDKQVQTNVHDLPEQCRAAWALHLGAIWGFKIDQAAVDAYELSLEESRAGQLATLTALGLYEEVTKKGETKDKKNTRAVQRMVARAYDPDIKDCVYCQSTGFVEEPQRYHKTTGKPLKRNTLVCSECEGVGLDFSKSRLPFTKGRSISTSRDTLLESGDEHLLLLAEHGESDKAIGTYIPYLRSAGHWPLTLKPNVMLETGRASYSDPIQQMPRTGKERDCFIPRPGFVFFSSDYVGLELASHAQSCLWLVDHSEMAKALNEGGKPHDMLGARLYGKTNAQFAALMEAGDKRAAALRQAAKIANFGFPGGMGPAKLVLAQRIQGPDTTAPDGKVYKGFRFCIAFGHATRCGEKKRMVKTGQKNEHGFAPESPACVACIEAATDLRTSWLKQWPENVAYFEFINDRVGDDRPVKQIIEHVSRRVRSGVGYTNAANGYFQALAALGAKKALYAVTKEQHMADENPQAALHGSRTILFTHDELMGELWAPTASAGAKRVADIMVREMKSVIPDVAISVEVALMERWYKGAKPVHDEEGNLLVWRPKEK